MPPLAMPWTIPNLVLHDKPVSLANMRTHGRNMCLSFAAIRTVIATLNWTSAGLPDNLTFGDLQPRMLCTVCDHRGAMLAPHGCCRCSSGLGGRRTTSRRR